MKRFLSILLLVGLSLRGAAQTASTRDNFNTEVDTNLPSGTGLVSAAQLRLTLKDLAASSYFPLTDGAITGGGGGGGGGGSGDMLKSIYDTNADNIIDVAASVDWAGVSNKPTIDYFLPSQAGKTGYSFVSNGAHGTWQLLSTGGGSTDNTRRTFTQTSHGFVPKMAIYYNGTAWAPALGTSPSTAEASAIVESIVDSNTFVAVFSGVFTPSTGGLTPGANYFVDATTPGAITTTEPVAAGQVGKPIMQAISSTQAIVNFQRSLTTDSQTPNLVFASPVSGTGAPDFRALVAGDLPQNSVDQILPNQSGQSGKFLKTNGSSSAWATAGTTTIAILSPDLAQLPASNAPTTTTLNNIHCLVFPKTGPTSPSAYWVSITPFNSSFPIGIHVYVHWFGTVNTGNVTWDASIEGMTHTETSDHFAPAVEITGTAAATVGAKSTTTINIGGGGMDTAMTASTPYRLLLTRRNTLSSDTMAGDAQVFAIEIQSY